ncbi:hypothetical protein HNP24_001820 [Chryseobacterium sediminis]|uniref:Uncharacterized protein n=1 Tax=Chryseobacterium sediminis TaxID=1679494 RepID=A0ABR6PYV3_9FLAO|nr:hypothetical protein [Chryseobacterium sediminis]
MNITFDRCALTGYGLIQENLKPVTGPFVEYETEIVGRVKITLPVYDELLKGDFERYLIAGICKDRTLKGEDPILIDSNFIREGYKKLNPPTERLRKNALPSLCIYIRLVAWKTKNLSFIPTRILH